MEDEKKQPNDTQRDFIQNRERILDYIFNGDYREEYYSLTEPAQYTPTGRRNETARYMKFFPIFENDWFYMNIISVSTIVIFLYKNSLKKGKVNEYFKVLFFNGDSNISFKTKYNKFFRNKIIFNQAETELKNLKRNPLSRFPSEKINYTIIDLLDKFIINFCTLCFGLNKIKFSVFSDIYKMYVRPIYLDWLFSHSTIVNPGLEHVGGKDLWQIIEDYGKVEVPYKVDSPYFDSERTLIKLQKLFGPETTWETIKEKFKKKSPIAKVSFRGRKKSVRKSRRKGTRSSRKSRKSPVRKSRKSPVRKSRKSPARKSR